MIYKSHVFPTNFNFTAVFKEIICIYTHTHTHTHIYIYSIHIYTSSFQCIWGEQLYIV